MDKQQGEELPNLVFLLRSVDGGGHDVYGLHTDGVSEMVVKRLFNCNPSYPLNSEFMVASDSKLCIVGGDIPHEGTDKFPRDFLMWDLTNWRKKEEGDFKCDRGPDTLGAKPYPCLFSLGEDIYALARICFYATDIPDPPFEFYDSHSNCWNTLPPPPFNGYYGDPDRSNCGIQHKLVGRTLYLALGFGYPEAYSYNVDQRIWTTIRSDGQLVIDDFAVKNMVTYCDWNRICTDDIDNDMVLFRCSDSIDMLACDFKANAKITHDGDVEMLDKSDAFDSNTSSPLPTDYDDLDSRSLSDFELLNPCPSYIYSDSESESPPDTAFLEVDVTYPYVPVTGLEEITGQVHRNRYSTSGFVAHLAGNIYCAVYFYRKPDDEYQSVLACKFDVAKDSGAADDIPDHIKSKFSAKILSRTSIGTYRNWIFLSQWFKIRV